MMTTSRSNVILAIVVVAAIAVASVVAVHGHGGATALGTYGAGTPAAAGLADTSTVASSTGSAATAADPAKQQPTLDQFTSRNPFIQATTAPGSGSTGTTTTPTSSTSPTPKAVSANITVKSGAVGATYMDQKVGDKLPPAGSAFSIQSIDSSGVTFKLLNGYTVGAGTNTTTFKVAQASAPTQVTLVNGAIQKIYFVTVVHISYAEGSSSSSSSGTSSSTGSSGTSSSTAGHSIKALSIETSNGVPSATITVDGTTFAARTVGQVTTTSWGQVKVIGINTAAQTVTILHADVQITLHVGQAVSK
jgi:hypothetical protein